MKSFQVALLLVVLVAVSAQEKEGLRKRLGNWVKGKLGEHQAAITKKIQDVTIKGDCKRKVSFPETVKKECKNYDAAIKEFQPEMLTGKWYANLRGTDILSEGEVVGNDTACYSYNIQQSGKDTFEITETSYTEADGSAGKHEVKATLKKVPGGVATFEHSDSKTGLTNVQLLDAKADDYMVLLWCKNTGDGKSLIKMMVASRTPEITVDGLLGFHNVVIVKNLDLNLHPRLFHMYNEQCPAV